ncbi:hypothetical protein RMATCC62417_09451 [Rhizopus microsporus]|nr:hypothetical protein RMATCC62417_09451 [Rhizopus microsporus]
MATCSSCRSKHVNLIEQCYPGKEGGTTPRSSELSYLTFYANSRPAKLSKVGSYIQKKVNKDIRKGRKENNQVSLRILKALIQSCYGDLNIFSKCLVNVFCKLLDTRDIDLIDLTCETFIVFCNYNDGSTLGIDVNFTQDYEALLKKFSSFCDYSNDDTSFELKMKYIGQRGIQAAVTSQALVSSNYKQQLGILLSPLMDVLTSTVKLSTDSTDGTIDIRESALNNNKLGDSYIQLIATHTLTILFNKLTGHYVRVTLGLLFDYMNRHKKWWPSDLSVSIMTIVVDSTQSQYRQLFLSEILQQLDPEEIMSDKQTALVCIIDAVLNASTPLLGVSVLEVLNSLFTLLVKAARYSSEEDKQRSTIIQKGLIHSIEGLASHTYYDNQLSDMAGYLVSKLKPHTTLSSVDHLPILEYRHLVLSCLDTIPSLPLDSFNNGMGLLEDKDPQTRLLFCKSLYQKIQTNSSQKSTVFLDRLLQAMYNWIQLPNLNLTDIRFFFAFSCILHPMFGMQATIMLVSLLFKVQEWVQEQDLQKQWVIQSLILAWLGKAAEFHQLESLVEYLGQFEQLTLDLTEKPLMEIELTKPLPSIEETKPPMWIDRSRIAEIISSESRLREEQDTHGLELEAKLFAEWGSETLMKHSTRLIQGPNDSKPKLSSPWEQAPIGKTSNERRGSIKVSTLKEVLVTQTNEDSDSTTQASSSPSEHKPSLNALLTELKLPPNNTATFSLVNPPYKT